ncbi:hypothetical protein WME98_33430 [Sorangium sp. So ce296]|uniref:hypothetical protein n=1 Tax=unclassified Sorangium TaxID=2621164 RepID=UPI003F5DD076
MKCLGVRVMAAGFDRRWLTSAHVLAQRGVALSGIIPYSTSQAGIAAAMSAR